MLKNAVKHFMLVTRHKWEVFKLCVKAGIPWRGLVHDLSKYSPTEFFESIKYYRGNMSPINVCRYEKGYSAAWLHHKGRNRHHYEYWFDNRTNPKGALMPYKYAVEMVCDNVAAGKIYLGKDWTKGHQIEYWNRTKEPELVNEKIDGFVTDIFMQIAEKGVEPVINKENLRKTYIKHCKS